MNCEIIFLLIILITSAYIFISMLCNVFRLKKNTENYENLVGSKDYLEKYPYTDDQNVWYSEFTESTFNNTLSNKKFTIKKNGTLIQNIEKWINNLKALQKPKSTLKIISLTKLKDSLYEMLLHRNGRNHGVVLNLDIIERNTEIFLKNIKFVGVKNEYELTSSKMVGVETTIEFGKDRLEYNDLKDMWSVTADEQLIN